jgi:hypothetical protein
MRIPATNRDESRRPMDDASEKRRNLRFRESAMNVLRKKGMVGKRNR